MADGDPIVATERRGAVAIAHLNRPEARNALSPELKGRLADLVEEWDAADDVRCIVIAGSDKVFAAGGDVEALAQQSPDAGLDDPAATFWTRLADCQTPLVAAVSGWALGGGCELALLCDMVVASETAEFGQPEIQLGIVPGGGGTQRLARVLGKQRTMELVLTGKRFTAQEAFELGLVNSVSGKREWFEDAVTLASVVAARPPIAAQLAKQAVLAADRVGLDEGLTEERRLFEAAMATEDRVEGMQAFLEKRRPEFKGR